MKIRKLAFIVTLLVFLLPGLALCEGTLTDKNGNSLTSRDWEKVGDSEISKLTFIATDDTTGIDEPIEVPKGLYGQWLTSCKTDPGTTAPTALYDIQIWHDSAGPDIFGGNLLNRSATDTENGNYDQLLPMDGNIVFKLDNNAVNNATVTVTCYAVPN